MDLLLDLIANIYEPIRRRWRKRKDKNSSNPEERREYT